MLPFIWNKRINFVKISPWVDGNTVRTFVRTVQEQTSGASMKKKCGNEEGSYFSRLTRPTGVGGPPRANQRFRHFALPLRFSYFAFCPSHKPPALYCSTDLSPLHNLVTLTSKPPVPSCKHSVGLVTETCPSLVLTSSLSLALKLAPITFLMAASLFFSPQTEIHLINKLNTISV